MDIFGYPPDFATVSFRTHVVARFGATSRPDEIEHGPDSLHVFFPREGVLMRDVNRVRAPFFNVDAFTSNPGSADTTAAVVDARDNNCARTVKV